MSVSIMSKRSFEGLLNHFDSPLWTKRVVDGTSEELLFLPVFTVSKNIYGVTSDGYWVADYFDKNRITEKCNYVAFLPLLEPSRSEIITLLRDSIATVGLPEKVLYTFPFDNILIFALGSKSSGYWREKAINWLENGYPMSDDIAQLLEGHKLAKKWKSDRAKKIFEE